MEVIPVEANSDNYMYLIVDNATKECAVVDPAEPKKVNWLFLFVLTIIWFPKIFTNMKS